MPKSRKVVTILISLLAAVLLWLYVVTLVTPEATATVSNIPITLFDMNVLNERDLIITDQNYSSLRLRVSTSRVNIPKLTADTIRVYGDVSSIREPGEYTLDLDISFPNLGRSNDVVILSQSVKSVSITVDKQVARELDVEFQWTGSVREGYLFDAKNAVLEPAKVNVSGPEQEIEKIDKAVVSYDVSDLHQTTSETLPIRFLDAEGNELQFSELVDVDYSELRLSLPVLRTREITLGLDLTEGGGVKAENAKVTLEPATIEVMGPEDVVDELEDVFMVGNVDLTSIPSRYDETFKLNLPAGVSCSSGETEVHASVRITGVSTDTVYVSDIRLTNVPEGYTAKLSTRTARVTVRGGTAEVKEIKQSSENGLYIEVDLSDSTQTGASTVTGLVHNPDHPDVSVAESVDIIVVLSEAGSELTDAE